MKSKNPRGIAGHPFFLIGLLLSCLLLTTGTAATAATFPQVHRQEQFLMQVLLQAVAGDFTGDGRTGLVVSGRNYESREAFAHLLYWDGNAFKTVWRSDNLWEAASHIAIAAGNFTGADRSQLAVLTDNQLRIFQWNGSAMAVVYDGPGVGAPAEIGVIGHPDHPYDLIAVSRRRDVERHMPRKTVELIGWRDGRFQALWETPIIGRVRAIASGAWNGGDRHHLVVDVGDTTSPGTVEVWSWNVNARAYVRTFQGPLRDSPTFGLATTRIADRDVLVAAEDRGYVTVYGFETRMPLLGQSSSLGWAVVSAAAGDFFGNGRGQAVVIGYPSRLHVVELQGL